MSCARQDRVVDVVVRVVIRPESCAPVRVRSDPGELRVRVVHRARHPRHEDAHEVRIELGRLNCVPGVSAVLANTMTRPGCLPRPGPAADVEDRCGDARAATWRQAGMGGLEVADVRRDLRRRDASCVGSSVKSGSSRADDESRLRSRIVTVRRSTDRPHPR